MTRLVALALAIAATIAANANFYRVWDQGPLAPADFSIIPGPGQTTRFAGEIVQTVGTDPDGRLVLNILAVASPKRSVGSDATLSRERLAWHQAQFDLLELSARNLQLEVNAGISGRRIDRLLREHNDNYAATIEEWAQRTRNGTDTLAVRHLLDDLQGRLAQSPHAPGAPLVPSPFGYGLYVATGPHWPAGDLRRTVGWGWDFTFGVRIIYRRLHINGQITYASSDVRNLTMVSDGMLPINPGFVYRASITDANYLGAGFNVGLDVAYTPTLSVVPFAGGMFSQYSWGARPSYLAPDGAVVFDGPQDGVTIGNFNLWFGIECEWHFNTTISSSGIMGAVRQQLTSSLGFKPYAVRQVYKKNTPHTSGWNIGFTLSYSGIIRNMCVSKPRPLASSAEMY